MRRHVSSALLIGSILILSGCVGQSEQQVLISEGVRHPVTDKMEGVTNQMAAEKAPSFALPDVNGNIVKSEDLLKRGPMVVISIKDECPCSFDSQPLFSAMSERYKDKATFVGLFNETPAKAAKYVKDTGTPYPVLLDPQLKTYRAFKAERSVYVTYVKSDGTIAKMWPGYWDAMLIELDAMLQADTKIKHPEFDPQYAPKAKSSGCQLYQGEGFTEGDKP